MSSETSGTLGSRGGQGDSELSLVDQTLGTDEPRPPHEAPPWRVSWVEVALGVVVWGLIVLPNYPGRINADTYGMLAQARVGDISDWHAPLVQLVWRPIDTVVPPGVLFGVQTALLLTTSYVVMRSVAASRLALLGTSVLWLNPLGYSVASQLTRDTWVVLGFSGFICGALSLRRARHFSVSARWPIALAVTSVVFILASRQNAAALLAFPAAMTVWNRAHRWRLPGACVAFAAALLLPLMVLGVANRALGVRAAGPETAIMLADLGAFSVETGEVKIPAAATSPGLTVEDISRLSTIHNPDQLWFGGHPAAVYIMLGAEARSEVREAWRELITEHPIEYLEIRSRLFLRQIGLSADTRNTYLPASIVNDAGLQSEFPDLAEEATEWIEVIEEPHAVLGWWASRAWIWLVVAAVAAVLLRRRGLIGGAVAVSAGLYVASTFPGATDLQYRFVGPAVIISQGLVVFAVLAITGRGADWLGDAALVEVAPTVHQPKN